MPTRVPFSTNANSLDCVRRIVVELVVGAGDVRDTVQVPANAHAGGLGEHLMVASGAAQIIQGDGGVAEADGRAQPTQPLGASTAICTDAPPLS